MTSNHEQVVAASDDERRFFVCDVSDKRRGDDAYFDRLVRVIKGDDDATLAAFMYELQTRNINNWKPEQAARKAASTDLARQNLLSLEPPLQWLLEQETTAPAVPAQLTGQDIGKPSATDMAILQHLLKLTPRPADPGKQDALVWERTRDDVLESYRYSAKSAQVRGATDYTGAETFWSSIKRLLNEEIFPARRLFRTSGGKRSSSCRRDRS